MTQHQRIPVREPPAVAPAERGRAPIHRLDEAQARADLPVPELRGMKAAAPQGEAAGAPRRRWRSRLATLGTALSETGPGIPQRRYRGRGVGRFVSRSVVGRLGGTLALDRRPGHRAAFRTRLPMRAAGAA